MRAPLPIVTVVTPVFNEEASLERFRAEVERTLFSSDVAEFRVLFVDDGSTDGSWPMLERFCRDSPRFSAVRLSRNFGSHSALSAGIDLAEGDAIATLACDLQDPPQTVIDFVREWRGGAQIVWGTRRTRSDGPLRTSTIRLFSWLMRTQAMPRGSKFSTGSFLLIDRLVADCFRQFREHNRITFALVAWTGFRQAVVPYDRVARQAGASGWSFGRMIKAMYDVLIGFSGFLPRFITLLGAAIFLMNIPILIYLVADEILARPFPGWTGLMVALCFFFGVVCLMLGVMSEYLHRIYVEVTGRPLYFIAQSTRNVRAAPQVRR